MTVKELIERLLQYDMYKEVLMEMPDCYGRPMYVDIRQADVREWGAFDPYILIAFNYDVPPEEGK